MADIDVVTVINTPYERGVPLKVWAPTDEHHAIMAGMVVHAADAAEAVLLLVDGGSVGTEEWAALGRVNYHAFLQGFEPLFALVGDRPVADGTMEYCMRRSIALNGPSAAHSQAGPDLGARS